MDTKSRSISSSPWAKLLAVILAVLGALVSVHGLLELPDFELAIDRAAYADSQAKKNQLANLYSWVSQASYYQDEDFIRSGGSSTDEISAYARNREEEYNQSVREINKQYASWISDAIRADNAGEADRLTLERDTVIEKERARLDQVIADYRDSLIEEHLWHYRNSMEKLNKPGTFFYFKSVHNQRILSNVENMSDIGAFFASLPAYTSGRSRDDSIVYAGISQERFAQLEEEYTTGRSKGTFGLYQTLAGLIIFLLGFAYVLYSAGRRPGAPGIHLMAVDRIYLDISLAALTVAVYFCVVGVALLLDQAIRTSEAMGTGSPMVLQLGGLLVAVGALLILLMGSMVAKRVKRGEFFKHTLICTVIASSFRFLHKRLRQVLDAGPIALRITALLAAYASVVTVSVLMPTWLHGDVAILMGIGLFLATNAAALLYILRKTAELQAISAGAERIGSGELSYRLPEGYGGITLALARSINNIAAGLKAAVESEVKSERMKAELITNVSHDLKTPLTSLITYVDLLKTEGLCSEDAPKYLDVLDKKSQRLKSLTEDLFEAAKAASGSLAMHLEKLDAGSLLSQGLGELSDRIEQSGLDFRVSIPSERLYVQADGKLLWRVIENLLSNVFKYALPGSRVYVEAGLSDNQVRLTFKNISAAALNVDPSELLERFKRGDESRHSEGSGLGLSIANSLTELQGGAFRIEVDGDLFKATVTLPRCA